MNHTLINNHLHISFPDDFQFLTRDELQEMYRSDNKDMWGIRDKAHKILLTVFHHKSSGFMVKVFGSPKEIAEQNERKLAAFYRDMNAKNSFQVRLTERTRTDSAMYTRFKESNRSANPLSPFTRTPVIPSITTRVRSFGMTTSQSTKKS